MAHNQVRWMALGASLVTLLFAAQASAHLPAQATETNGFGAPGYPDYHLGQALLTRGEMQVRLHSRIELRAGLWAGEDNQLLHARPRRHRGSQGRPSDASPPPHRASPCHGTSQG